MWAEAKAIKVLWRKAESRVVPLTTPTLCCSDRNDALEWRHIPGLVCMGGYSDGGSWCLWLLVMVTALIGCAHALHRDNLKKNVISVCTQVLPFPQLLAQGGHIIFFTLKFSIICCENKVIKCLYWYILNISIPSRTDMCCIRKFLRFGVVGK